MIVNLLAVAFLELVWHLVTIPTLVVFALSELGTQYFKDVSAWREVQRKARRGREV